MEDTNVKLTVDLGNRVLSGLSRMGHHLHLTVDVGPNTILGLKCIAGTLLVYKTIDVSVNFQCSF
jgi:hypothetical protein